MTCTLISSLAAGLVLMAGTASAQSWTDWGVADLRALIEAENGVVTDERLEANGEITVDVKMDDWLAVSVFGFACSEGDIETIRCQGLSLAALYETDDPARAERLQRELSFSYVADAVLDDDYQVQRDIDLTNGASLDNIRGQLSNFVALNERIADAVWATDPTAAVPSE